MPRSLARLGKILHLLASSVIIFALAYFLGYPLLSGPLRGSDSALHLGYARWLEIYFPHVPHWYPLQGGGQSLLHGYPILAHLLLIGLHQLSGLSLLQTFRLISFAVFPLSALGIYLYGWIVFRNQTVGLIAAIFYLAAPITWTWMYDWGFFPQQVAFVFLPLALIAFDQTLTLMLNQSSSRLKWIWFVGLVILILLATFTHVLIATAIAAGIGLYTLFAALVRPDRSAMLRSGLTLTVLTGLTVGVLAAFYLVPFYAYGQVANREGLNTPAPHQLHRLPPPEFFGLHAINPKEILTRMQFPLAVTLLALVGILLAFIYVRKNSAEARKPLAWALVGGVATIYALTPELVELVLKVSPFLMFLINFRSLLLLVMVLLPVIAAYGVWSLARAFFDQVEILRHQYLESKVSSDTSRFPARPVWVALLSLFIAAGGLGWLWRFTAKEPWRVAYGPLPQGIDLHDLWHQRLDDICELPDNQSRPPLCNLPAARASLNVEEFGEACQQVRAKGGAPPPLCQTTTPSESLLSEFLLNCRKATDLTGDWRPCRARLETVIAQLSFKNWPAFALDDQDPDLAYSQHLAEALPTAGLRIDISPYLGRLAEDLSGFAQASQINSYAFQINLVHAMWGYQQNVFYSHEAPGKEYGTPQALNELAQWFGTEYVFLNPVQDPLETYQAAGWQPVLQTQPSEIWQHPSQPGYLFLSNADPANQRYQAEGWKPVAFKRPLELWRYPTPINLVTLTTRPAVLIIGKQKTNAYMNIFRLANNGVLLYSKALIVEGRAEVDQYTLEELKPFAALVLYGYDYQNSHQAWDTLAAYVQQGGSLFVDTGWEFQVPEWEFAQAPEVLPVKRLTWTNYGMTHDYRLAAPEIAGDLNPDLFAPLIWEGQPWSVSGAQPSDVREWGQVILSATGRPLIVAGEYGTGRVIWSGMNLIAHATSGEQNAEELHLLSNLLDWLIKEKSGADLALPLVTRNDPDHVAFAFQAAPGQTTWLYWREAYYPDWRAYLTDEHGQQSLPIYRAGPGFMLMPLQTASTAASVKLAWEASPAEQAATGLSMLGALVFLALMVDGLLFGGRGRAAIKQAIATQRRPKPAPKQVSVPQWPEPPPLEED